MGAVALIPLVGGIPFVLGLPVAVGFPMLAVSERAVALLVHGDLLQYWKQVTPVGTLTVLLVDAARDHVVPIMVGASCALATTCVLAARRLLDDGSASGRPFEEGSCRPGDEEGAPDALLSSEGSGEDRGVR